MLPVLNLTNNIMTKAHIKCPECDWERPPHWNDCENCKKNMTTESRRDFEEWAKDKEYDLAQGLYCENRYNCELTRAALDGWQAARERQWMPIETAPDITEILVFSDSFFTIWIATKLDGKWVDASDGRSISNPTHWMPLPNQPTNEPNE